MDTKTITVTLPKSGFKAELKTELVGYDLMAIEVAPADAKLKIDRKSKDVQVDTKLAYELRYKKLVEIIVISLNDNKDKEYIWNAYRGLGQKDYTFLKDLVDEVAAGGIEPEEEKKSDEPLQ